MCLTLNIRPLNDYMPNLHVVLVYTSERKQEYYI